MKREALRHAQDRPLGSRPTRPASTISGEGNALSIPSGAMISGPRASGRLPVCPRSVCSWRYRSSVQYARLLRLNAIDAEVVVARTGEVHLTQPDLPAAQRGSVGLAIVGKPKNNLAVNGEPDHVAKFEHAESVRAAGPRRSSNACPSSGVSWIAGHDHMPRKRWPRSRRCPRC